MYKQQDTSVPRNDHADYKDVSFVLYCEILFPLYGPLEYINKQYKMLHAN